MRKYARCTKENPYTKERDKTEGPYWQHQHSEEISSWDDYDGAEIVKYRCKVCGITWKTVLGK